MFIKNKNRPQPTKSNFAFIDSQNLNLGTQKMGWKLDWRRFRQFLEKNYDVSKAYMFIGYMSENEQLYEYMNELGFTVVLRPTISKDPDTNTQSNGTPGEKHSVKGNVDVELALYAVKEMPNYDQAVIISGDGDFYSLIEYLNDNNKLRQLITPNWQYSSLLKAFDSKIVSLDKYKRQLTYHDRK